MEPRTKTKLRESMKLKSKIRRREAIVMSLKQAKRRSSRMMKKYWVFARKIFYQMPTFNAVILSILFLVTIALLNQQIIDNENASSFPKSFLLVSHFIAILFDKVEAIAICSATVAYLKKRPHRTIDQQNELSKLLSNAASFANIQILIEALEQKNFEGVSFANCNFSVVEHLVKIRLRRADLSNTNFHNVNLQDADLQGADLSKSNLCRVNMRDAKLRKANFQDANLFKADLRKADLSGAILGKADLTETNLQGANLSGVSLRQAHFDHTIMPDGKVWNTSHRNFWKQ
jgi:uncharacterized protein YjbI with pentapeptide repeats